MAGAGEWELVVRGSKKSKTVANGKLNKEEKRQFMEKALRLTDTGRIEPAREGKENRKPASPKVKNEQKNDQKKKKPEKKSNSVRQPGTLEEAIRKLNVAEMQNLLDVVTARFLDTPLIWLKDLASYLNVRINPIHMPDPTFKGKPDSYPTSLVSSQVKKLLLQTLSGCNDKVLAAFHKHCVTSMVQEQVKGLSVAGYKVFIQIMSMHRPHICVVNLPAYCELRQSFQSQTPTCLSLLWAIGQAGINDFNVGLKVWLEMMVPMIGLKNYSSFVVDYGSSVFGGGGGGEGEDSTKVLGVREFFSILDFTWCNSGSLSKPIQRQLFALYPKVKTTAFSSRPEVTLRNFFPSFLRRLDPSAPHLLRVELLTCLVQCLTQDPHCWKTWSQMYLKHMPQSALLLVHLGKEWKILSQSLRIKRQEVLETIEGFASANEKMLQKAAAVAGTREANKATKFLLEEMKVAKKKTSRPYMTKLLVILLVTVIVWDIRSAGSFYGSKIGQVFERLGLVPYIEVVGRTLKKLFVQSYKWSILNIPLYYGRGCELAGPYLLLVLAKAEAVWGYIMSGVEATSEYLPVIKTKLDTAIPGLSESLIYYGSAVFEGVCSLASSVGNTARPYLLNFQELMMSRVFVGPLSPENLYQYVVGAFDKVSEVILRVHTNLLMALDDKAHVSSKTV
ncbi:transmembrane protein 214 [Penaeus vannamei]|uniref:Transmembrane protein 214 n=1 Tax=Penaeus vannamei TaxID=6689 RepID=A0A423TTV6_PENVA|nr:transmembrane protein 214-like [Penaeus vannamei]ROT79841.1 hypothetical protein C7M84_001465 [Penaeus vannamei]